MKTYKGQDIPETLKEAAQCLLWELQRNSDKEFLPDEVTKKRISLARKIIRRSK